jgi:hypothetical protein
MPGKKYRVTLTEDEKEALHEIINKGKHSAQNANGRRPCCSPKKGIPMI